MNSNVNTSAARNAESLKAAERAGYQAKIDGRPVREAEKMEALAAVNWIMGYMQAEMKLPRP